MAIARTPHSGRPGRARRRTGRQITTTAIVAVGVLGVAAARPAFATAPAPVRRLQPADDLWLDRRFAELSELAAVASVQDAGERRYDIPAGPLDGVLRAYQAASGVVVTVMPDLLSGIESPGLSGMFTARRALGRGLR